MMQDIRNLVDQIAMSRTQLSKIEIETMLWNLVELAMKTQKAIDGAHGEQTP